VITVEEIARLVEDLNPELTVFVEPHRAEELRAQLAAAGLPARVTVVASALVPAGRLLVANQTLLRRGLEDAIRKQFRAWGDL
jgi:hypothetical protein